MELSSPFLKSPAGETVLFFECFRHVSCATPLTSISRGGQAARRMHLTVLTQYDMAPAHEGCPAPCDRQPCWHGLCWTLKRIHLAGHRWLPLGDVPCFEPTQSFLLAVYLTKYFASYVQYIPISSVKSARECGLRGVLARLDHTHSIGADIRYLILDPRGAVVAVVGPYARKA